MMTESVKRGMELRTFYILIETWSSWPTINGRTVYVKDGNFFIEQGGLEEDWGKTWIPVKAYSIEHARELGETMEIIE